MREDKSPVYIAVFAVILWFFLGANLFFAGILGLYLYFAWVYFKDTREEYNSFKGIHKILRTAAYIGALAIGLYLFLCSIHFMNFAIIKVILILLLVISAESKIYSDNH